MLVSKWTESLSSPRPRTQISNHREPAACPDRIDFYLLLTQLNGRAEVVSS